MALTIKLDLDTAKFKAGLKQAERGLKQTSAKLNSFSSALAAKAAIGTAALGGMGFAISRLVKDAALVETTQAQFETLTGSIQRADKLTRELVKFGATTPFELKELTGTTKVLLGFGFRAENITGILQNLGDVSASVGVPIKDLARIFGQVNAVGKLTAERLNQLEERAVPIGPAIAKAMGISQRSVRQMVTEGKVSAEIFNKAMKSISEAGGLAFGGMEKRSKTLEGQISNLQDAFFTLSVGIGKHFLPVVKESVTSITDFITKIINNEEAVAKIAKTIRITTTLVAVLTAKFALGAIATKAMAISLGLVSTATKLARIAFVGASNIAGFFFTTIKTGGKGALLAAKQLGVMRVGINLLKISIKGLLGATGFGLLFAFLPELVTKVFNSWDSIVAASKAAIGSIIKMAQALGGALKAAFTGNFEKVKEEFVNFKEAAASFSDDIVKAWVEAPAKIAEARELAAEEKEKMLQEDAERAARRLAMEQANDLKEANAKIKMEAETNKKTAEQEKQSALEEKRRRKEKLDTKITIHQNAAKALIGILGEESKAAFFIQKAVSLSDVYMNTAAAIMKAMATLPVPLSLGYKALIYTTGAAQAATILAQQPPKIPAAQTGGIVPRISGTPLSGDFQPMMLEAGELITPSADVKNNRIANKLILDTLANKGDDFFKEDEAAKVDISFTGEASSLLEAQTIENRVLGVGVR